ncbi:hypothetical protein [Phenylobacterium sp.]|jgi:hypothetical protein|uniref:hypothetical protein n=1 Tax=Phenylobacterium sp. TaxID=1871053 RepID=UPI002F3E9DA4
MSDYRLYVFDRAGHVRGVTVLSCESDEEAAAYARSHSDGQPMELWLGDRPIRRFDTEGLRHDSR